MEHFAKSRFWRAAAVALVAALFALAWSIAGGGERSLLPVAQAGGVADGPGSALYSTDETGSILYVWHAGGGIMEKWSYDLGQVSRKRAMLFELPGARPGDPLPPPPGGTPDGRTPGPGGR